MFDRGLLLYTFLSTAAAAFSSSTPTVTTPCPRHVDGDLTTPPAHWQPARALRKRLDGAAGNTQTNTTSAGGTFSTSASTAPVSGPFVCGYAYGDTFTCNDKAAICVATILPNSHAIQYCSTRGAATQPIYTTYIESWPTKKACPPSTWCCQSPYGIVITNYFIASKYTVTGFDCWTTTDTINTWDPALNVLNPTKFSKSLAQLGTTSRSGSASSTSSSKNNSSGGGLSTGAKAGIGAGVGVGVGLLLIAGALSFFYRRNQKRKQRIVPNGASQEPYSDKPLYGQSSPHSSSIPYTPEMGDNQAQYLQPYHHSDAWRWSQEPPYQQGQPQRLSAQPYYAELEEQPTPPVEAP